MQPNTQDAFDQLVSANSDLAVSMHAMYMLRRLRSMGILAEYIQKDGVFSHLRVPANDGARLEIRPQTLRINEVVTTQPMMYWNEYPESLREAMEKADKPTGLYRYSAQFELIVVDNDQDYPDHQTLEFEVGEFEFANFPHTASDFQQFIFGAIFHIKASTGIEFYPAFRKSRVAL